MSGSDSISAVFVPIFVDAMFIQHPSGEPYLCCITMSFPDLCGNFQVFITIYEDRYYINIQQVYFS